MQQRSRDTHDAIVVAFRRALATTPYDLITVADIASEASTSVGGFYARFSSKEALLLPLIEDMTADFQTKLVSALDEVDRKNGHLADVVGVYVRTMLTEFQHGRVLQQVFRRNGEVAAAIGERVHEFNQTVHDQFRTRARKGRDFLISARRDRNRFVHGLGDRPRSDKRGNWRSYTTQPDDAALSRARSRPRYSLIRSDMILPASAPTD
jgi:AcrR family transcriptional regulator